MGTPLGPFVELGLLSRVNELRIMSSLWVEMVCEDGLLPVTMFLIWESVALERGDKPEIMTALWVEIVSGSGLLVTRFVVWGARMPTVVEVINGEILSDEKRTPLVLGDGPFWVDGEEGGPGGGGDEGSDEELPLSNEGLLEAEGGVALLPPSEREEPPGEGESVEGVEFGLVGLCTGTGEG